MLFKKVSFILEIDIAYSFFMKYDAHIVLLRERWCGSKQQSNRPNEHCLSAQPVATNHRPPATGPALSPGHAPHQRVRTTKPAQGGLRRTRVPPLVRMPGDQPQQQDPTTPKARKVLTGTNPPTGAKVPWPRAFYPERLNSLTRL